MRRGTHISSSASSFDVLRCTETLEGPTCLKLGVFCHLPQEIPRFSTWCSSPARKTARRSSSRATPATLALTVAACCCYVRSVRNAPTMRQDESHGQQTSTSASLPDAQTSGGTTSVDGVTTEDTPHGIFFATSTLRDRVLPQRLRYVTHLLWPV